MAVGNAPRPMSAVTAAGFSVNPLATETTKSVFDDLPKDGVVDSVDKKAEGIELTIFKLLRDGMQAAAARDFATALGRIREAIKLERDLKAFRTNTGTGDQINKDLTICVWMHMAQVQARAGQLDQALQTFEKLVKNTDHQSAAQIRLQMGRILYTQGNYPAAIRNYRMALDQAPPEYARLRQSIARQLALANTKQQKWQDAIDTIEENLVKSFSLADSKGNDQGWQNPYAVASKFEPLFTLIVCYFAMGNQSMMLDAFTRLVDSSILVGDHPDSLDLDDMLSESFGRQALLSDGADGGGGGSTDEELDELSRHNAALRHEQRRRILLAARLLAPVVTWQEIQGYEKLSAILKERGHHGMALQLQMSKALSLLRHNEFDAATRCMQAVDQEGLESALALGINVPQSVLQKSRNLSLAAQAVVSQTLERDYKILGINPADLAAGHDAGASDGAARAAAGDYDAAAMPEGDHGNKQPYATFVPRGVHTNISFVYYLRGDYENALSHSQIALEIDPYDSFARVNLGCTLARLNRWDAGLKEFREASQINSDCLQAVYNAGLVHHREQNYGEACECFQRVATRLPAYTDAVFMHAECLARLARVDQAVALLTGLQNSYAQLKAQDPGILVRLGELYMVSGDESQAAHCFREAHRLTPYDVDIISWLGAHYIRNELYEQARACFERAAHVEAGTPKWLLMIAACLRKTNQLREAATEYRRILRLFPAEAEAMRHLVSILTKLGNVTETEEWAAKLERLSAHQPAGAPTNTDADMQVMAQRHGNASAKPRSTERQAIEDKPADAEDADIFGNMDIAGELLMEGQD